MKFALFLLVAFAMTACSLKTIHSDSAQGVTKSAQSVKPEVDVEKIDKTISHLKEQLSEIQSLESKASSNAKNTKLRKELESKIGHFGSVESLQANIKFLEILKSDVQPIVAEKTKSSISKN
jgi:hypothetical protein